MAGSGFHPEKTEELKQALLAGLEREHDIESHDISEAATVIRIKQPMGAGLEDNPPIEAAEAELKNTPPTASLDDPQIVSQPPAVGLQGSLTSPLSPKKREDYCAKFTNGMLWAGKELLWPVTKATVTLCGLDLLFSAIPGSSNLMVRMTMQAPLAVGLLKSFVGITLADIYSGKTKMWYRDPAVSATNIAVNAVAAVALGGVGEKTNMVKGMLVSNMEASAQARVATDALATSFYALKRLGLFGITHYIQHRREENNSASQAECLSPAPGTAGR